MPKLTAKYRSASDTARVDLGLSGPFNDQETLYRDLQDAGYFWDSKAKSWDYFEPADANPPSKMIMVRCWADLEIIEEVADEITSKVKRHWELMERSTVYPCRPPKQLEGRIYLKFLPKAVS